MSTELGLVWVGAFLASTHCLGMCGCFAVLAGTGSSGLAGRLVSQLVYSAGRLFTYAFLGVLAGRLGAELLGSAWGARLASVLAMFSAVLFCVIGLQMLGLWQKLGGPGRQLASWFTLGLAPAIRHFSGSGTRLGTALTGVLTGFLPCGLVYAFALRAAATGDPGSGLVLMLVFGLGTVPAMVTAGMLGGVLSVEKRRYLYRATGVVLIVLGAITFTRGQAVWAGPQTEAPACHGTESGAGVFF